MLTTNVMRILEKQGIRFSSKEYEYDESDLSGQHAAEVQDLYALKGSVCLFHDQFLPNCFLSCALSPPSSMMLKMWAGRRLH